MELFEALEQKKYDLRMIDRLVEEGKLSKSEVKSYLASLVDDESSCEFVEIEKQEDESVEAPAAAIDSTMPMEQQQPEIAQPITSSPFDTNGGTDSGSGEF